MVAVALVAAAVIVVSMLQGRAATFGDFADSETNSSSCSIGETKFRSALDCDESSSGDLNQGAEDVKDDYPSCNGGWDYSSYCN